jgi:hypothetical protein
MAGRDSLIILDDDMLHEFVVVEDRLNIKPAFQHFLEVEEGTKHGYLIIDHGKIALEGCNFPVDEFEKIKKNFIVVKS